MFTKTQFVSEDETPEIADEETFVDDGEMNNEEKNNEEEDKEESEEKEKTED